MTKEETDLKLDKVLIAFERMILIYKDNTKSVPVVLVNYDPINQLRQQNILTFETVKTKETLIVNGKDLKDIEISTHPNLRSNIHRPRV